MDGQAEGVGMRIQTNGNKDYAQWHLNNMCGSGKVEWADVAVIGENTKMPAEKVMGQGNSLMVTDTSGNGLRITNTATGYLNGPVEEYTTESTKKGIMMDKGIRGGRTATNIEDHGRMV